MRVIYFETGRPAGFGNLNLHPAARRVGTMVEWALRLRIVASASQKLEERHEDFIYQEKHYPTYRECGAKSDGFVVAQRPSSCL